MQAFDAALPQFEQAGAEVLAITGELPEHFREVAPNLAKLSFPVLWDEGYSTMQMYGIAYELTAELGEFYAGKGLDLTAANATAAPMLPLPSVYVVRQSGEVSAAWVALDHTVRPEVDEVLAAVQAIGAAEQSPAQT